MWIPSKGRRDLEDRLERLERAAEMHRLEWEELLDKVQRWMQRTAARVRAEGAEEARAAAVLGRDGANLPTGTDPISARILARRGRVAPSDGPDREEG